MQIKITPVDQDAVDNGVWTNYRGVQLKIARANNDKFKNSFLKLSRPYQKRIAANNFRPGEEDILKDILCRSMAQGILVGWDNFEIEGVPLPFSEDTAYELLMNDPDCREFINEFSQDVENFVKADKEETLSKS